MSVLYRLEEVLSLEAGKKDETSEITTLTLDNFQSAWPSYLAWQHGCGQARQLGTHSSEMPKAQLGMLAL